MQDVYGNYITGLESLGEISTVTSGLVGSGAGAPDASTPTTYLYYIDNATGLGYVYVAGTGWVLASSGAGAGAVYASAVDPNGVVTASGPAVCVGKGALDGAVWVRSTAGSGNTGWEKVIHE